MRLGLIARHAYSAPYEDLTLMTSKEMYAPFELRPTQWEGIPKVER